MRANRKSKSGSDLVREQPLKASHSSLPWFLVVSAVALLLRVIHLVLLRRNDPLFFSPQMDALYHHEWALAIAAGREFIADAFFRAPLYPCFLGLLYKLFGANLMVVRIVQALIGSAGCGLVYLLACRFSFDSPKSAISNLQSRICNRPGEGIARASGLIMAAYPLAIWYDGELLLEGLLTFLLVLGFVLLLRSRDSDSRWWLPGAVFGLAAITRPNVLAFLAVLPVWLFLEGKGFRGPRVQGFGSRTGTPEPQNPGTLRRVWVRLALVWGAAAVVILPVTIRNYVVSRQFVPIAWQAGTNFYIGNNPESDGVTAIAPGTRTDWWGGYDDVKRLAEEAAGRPLKGAEIDRYWLGKGLEFWLRQPGKALDLLLRKTFLWFAGHEVSNERDLYTCKRYSFINYLFFSSRFLKFPFGAVLPLALAGVWFSRSRWRRFLLLYLFVGAYSLSFIAFFVTSRYRMAVVPIAVFFAAVGLMGLIGRTGVTGRQRTAALVIGVVAFLLFNANLAAAGRAARADQTRFATALGLREQGKDAEALAEVRRALQYDTATNVLRLEVRLLREKGDFAGAERAARAAVRLYPRDADAYNALGGVLATAGRLDSAEVYYEAALGCDPYSIQTWKDLGNIAFARKDFAAARRYYEGALKLRPTYALAMYRLGCCYYYEGKVAEARARWQQALKLDPSFTKAKQALEQLK